MIHHVYVPRTILACALLALVATVSPANAAANGDNFTEPAAYGASFPAPAAPEVIAPASTPTSIADLAATGEIFQAAAMPAVITPAAATVTTNGLLTFTNQAEFQTAFPRLPREDFEESPVANGAITVFPAPLDSSTNVASAFAPGDILPGLTIQNLNPSPTPSQAMFVEGVGHHNANTSKIVGMTFTGQVLSIEFSSTVNAVGMDLLLWSGGGGTTVSIYGAAGLIDTLTPTVGTTVTFLGIYSSEPITRITVSAPGDLEMVDNIQFGSVTQNVTFSADRTAFTAAYPGLTIEDFEESPVAPGALVQFGEPLTSTTNAPGAFSPGDIVAGLAVRTISTATPATSLVVLGDHYSGIMANASKLVCTRLVDDNLKTQFTAYNAYAVGMDLLPAVAAGSGNRQAMIIAYGVLGNILGTTTVTLASTQETFVGMYSSKYLILQATVTITGLALQECVDNIRFGGSPKDLTFYTSKTEFNKVRSNLPMEDFSESTVADNVTQSCDEPINSTSNQPNCFSPGDIKPNISFQTVDSLGAGCPTCMLVYGRNYGGVGNTTPLLTAVSPDMLEISFTGKNIYFVGIDMYTPGIMHIYDNKGTFLGEAVGLPTSYGDFWGVESAKPISRIAGYMASPVIGAVQFGSRFPWAMFQPTINGGPAPVTP